MAYFLKSTCLAPQILQKTSCNSNGRIVPPSSEEVRSWSTQSGSLKTLAPIIANQGQNSSLPSGGSSRDSRRSLRHWCRLGRGTLGVLWGFGRRRVLHISTRDGHFWPDSGPGKQLHGAGPVSPAKPDGAHIMVVVANIFKAPALLHCGWGHEIRANDYQGLGGLNQFYFRQWDHHLCVKTHKHWPRHPSNVELGLVARPAPAAKVYLPVCQLHRQPQLARSGQIHHAAATPSVEQCISHRAIKGCNPIEVRRRQWHQTSMVEVARSPVW